VTNNFVKEGYPTGGEYSGAMSRRGVPIAAALALGVMGGALLGGCGGGTKTVSVSEAAAPTTATGGATTTSGPTHTTTTTKTPAPATTTGAGQETAGQSTSTTRTAPAPAFTETGTQSGAAAAGAQATAAAAVVVAHGYTPTDVSDYHPTQTLRVLVGTRAGSADGYAQRAFFFLDGRYLGTDSSQPSASVHVVSQSDTEVALAYALYRTHDPLCCPSGGQAVVHFQLNNGTLVPLQLLPPVSSATGLARQ
jgi:LppP/LprE lipoprotein